MTRILLIRHATTGMIGKRIAGRMPGVSLNEKGKQEAEALARRLKQLPIRAVYSSPLERALETAAPLAASRQLPVTITDAVTELDYGEWTGLGIEEIKSQPRYSVYHASRSTTQIPGGEWMAEAQLRMVQCLQGMCAKHPDETIAVVSHGDPIKSAIAHYTGIHLDLLQRIVIDPASVSIIDIHPETVRIIRLNDTGEL